MTFYSFFYFFIVRTRSESLPRSLSGTMYGTLPKSWRQQNIVTQVSPAFLTFEAKQLLLLLRRLCLKYSRGRAFLLQLFEFPCRYLEINL